MAEARNAKWHFEDLEHPRFTFKVPTNFKLLQELEYAEKDKFPEKSEFVTLGIDDDFELDASHPMKRWQSAIIPEQGKHIGDRIYSLKISVGPDYPDTPPTVWFVQRVGFENGLVDEQKGEMNMHRFSQLYGFQWTVNSTIYQLCLAIRNGPFARHSQACAQIKADTTYPNPGYRRTQTGLFGW